MPKQGARRKKTRTHKIEEQDEQVPKSFVIHRKNIKQGVKELLTNFREVMYPYTAMKLQMKEKVKLSDYINACKVYQMSHLMVFTSTNKHNYMKIIQAPSGPTLTFKILSYCTMQDIIDSQTKIKSFPRTFSTPILITNGFQDVQGQYKIVQQVMQSAFPALNVAKQQVGQIRRSIFMDFNGQKDLVYLRHYHIQSTPNNINKNLKKVMKSNKVPDLSKYDDVSQYFLKNNNNSNVVSDSEGEDLPDNTFVQNKKSQVSQNQLKYQQAIRLHEVGPRMALRLIKIQEGVMTGKIIYHKLIKKTAEEILEQTNKIQTKIRDKQKRKDEMQRIIQQKEQEKLDKKQRKKQKAQIKMQLDQNQNQIHQEDDQEQEEENEDPQQIDDQYDYEQVEDQNDDDEDDQLDDEDDQLDDEDDQLDDEDEDNE